VEALALEHQGGLFEVACNLLDPDVTSAEVKEEGGGRGGVAL
jgi:hypothetical protein